MPRLLLYVMLVLPVVVGPDAVAEPSATRPASSPALPQVREWLAGLSDPDPGIRDSSRNTLLGLGRSDLPVLLEAARESQPLDATQSAALKEIVVHDYLTGEPYEKTEEGFLGITMPGLLNAQADMQVVVEGRMPGFASYRWLADGDAILDIEEKPLRQPAQQTEFKRAIREIRPGTTIHLKVLRQGKIIRVAIRLDPRPVENLLPVTDDVHGLPLIRHRREAGERYWRAFAAEMRRETNSAAARGG